MRVPPRLLGAWLALLAAACTWQHAEEARPDELGELAQAVGEPADGYPNYGERAILYFTNRVRLDAGKATDLGCPRNFTGIASKPPLDLSWNLSWSARFHSSMMQKAPCWQHDSCCYIQGTGLSAYCCDVATGAGCSATSEKYTCSGCVTGGCPGTSTSNRLRTSFQYSGNGWGENIALDKDVQSAFCAWFDEGPWANDGKQHGHFTNIMSEPNDGSSTPNWNEMGAGAIDAPTCGGYYGGRYTQDFGLRSGITKAAIPSAIHRPPSGASVTIGAIWNSTAAPRLMSVVVDGMCTPLNLAAGSASVGAYEAAVPISSGCHGYYIQAVDGTGAAVSHPTSGSLQAGSAASSCSSDYTSARTTAQCCNAQVPCSSGTCVSGTCQAGPGLDAGTPGRDAAAPGPDAAAPGLDAAAPGLDASAPGRDAAAPGLDAAAPGLDASAPGRDAAAPGLDAAAPGLDASAPGRDAAAPGLDASAPGRDAAAPGLDAAAPGPDAATVRPDAATACADASTSDPDAATPGPDAATLRADASAPGEDAAAPGPDASVSGVDAAVASPDAAVAVVPDAQAPETPDADLDPTATIQAGCGCSTGAASLMWPALALVGLVRRRSR